MIFSSDNDFVLCFTLLLLSNLSLLLIWCPSDSLGLFPSLPSRLVIFCILAGKPCLPLKKRKTNFEQLIFPETLGITYRLLKFSMTPGPHDLDRESQTDDSDHHFGGAALLCAGEGLFRAVGLLQHPEKVNRFDLLIPLHFLLSHRVSSA